MKARRFFAAVFFLAFVALPSAFSQESLEEESAVKEESQENDEVEEEPQNLYLSFVDSMKKIRFLETSDDCFSANELPQKGRSLVSSANGKFQRRFYGDDLRLQKIEYWKQGASSAQSLLERELFFNPPKKNGERDVLEKNYGEKSERRTFYLGDGKIKSQRVDWLDENGAVLSFDVFNCEYDKKGRTVLERLQKYSVDRKNVRLSSDERRVWVYNKSGLEEKSYYKNSVLRVRTVYQDEEKGDYVQTSYFDGGLIARDFYRNNEKVGSTIANGGGDGK